MAKTWEALPVPTLRCMVVREGPAPKKKARISDPAKAAAAFQDFFRHADREMFAVMLLNTKNDVLGINLVSMGTLGGTTIHPREVFRPALIAPCRALILGHNHPSGDPDPSADDLETTRRLIKAGQLLGIEIFDHVILGDAGFVSLRAHSPRLWEGAEK